MRWPTSPTRVEIRLDDTSVAGSEFEQLGRRRALGRSERSVLVISVRQVSRFPPLAQVAMDAER